MLNADSPERLQKVTFKLDEPADNVIARCMMTDVMRHNFKTMTDQSKSDIISIYKNTQSFLFGIEIVVTETLELIFTPTAQVTVNEIAETCYILEYGYGDTRNPPVASGVLKLHKDDVHVRFNIVDVTQNVTVPLDL